MKTKKKKNQTRASGPPRPNCRAIAKMSAVTIEEIAVDTTTPEPAPPSVGNSARDNLVYGFNTFYGELLSGIAKTDELLKKRLKKNYRVLNRKSDAYLVDFHASAKATGALETVFESDGEASEQVLELQVARGMRFKDVPKDTFPTVRLLCAIAWLFSELCALSDEADEADEAGVFAINELFQRLVESVSRVQSGLPWGDALDGMVDEEARSIFRSTLGLMTEKRGSEQTNQAAIESMADAFDMMKCSKLGSIVQEISRSIDQEKLRKAVETGNILSGENMDVMGELFKQVSGAITSKLHTGEISNEDLIKETANIMSGMKGLM